MRLLSRLAFILVVFASLFHSCLAFAFDFPGYFYTSEPFLSDIRRYDRMGRYLDSLIIRFPSDGLKGIAFGPDGLLYAVAADPPIIGNGYTVLALDAQGTIHKTYAISDNYVVGSLYLGRIVFDQQGHFYVGSSRNLTRFTMGDSYSGVNLIPSYVHDVDILPNGNFLIADNYHIREITPTGDFVREIPTPNLRLIDLQSIAYDAPPMPSICP